MVDLERPYEEHPIEDPNSAPAYAVNFLESYDLAYWEDPETAQVVILTDLVFTKNDIGMDMGHAGLTPTTEEIQAVADVISSWGGTIEEDETFALRAGRFLRAVGCTILSTIIEESVITITCTHEDTDRDFQLLMPNMPEEEDMSWVLYDEDSHPIVSGNGVPTELDLSLPIWEPTLAEKVQLATIVENLDALTNSLGDLMTRVDSVCSTAKTSVQTLQTSFVHREETIEEIVTQLDNVSSLADTLTTTLAKARSTLETLHEIFPS